MIKNFFTKLGLIVFTLTIITACGSRTNLTDIQSLNQNKNQTIKIGVITDISGSNSAVLGAGARNAAQMALEDMQVKQKLTNHYQLVFEDDQMDPKKTISAFHKLVDIDRVRAVLSFASNAGNAVTPRAEQEKIIHFSAASDPNVAQGLYNFIHWTQPQQEAETLMQKIIQDGFKSVAIIQLFQEGLVAVSNEIKKIGDANKINVSVENVNEKEMDFRTIISRSLEKRPDIFYVAFFSPQLETFVKQFKELNVNKPITTTEAFEYSPTPELFNGYWYVSAAEPTNQFKDNYFERYKINPTIASGNAYDMISILVWAYENVDDPNNNESVARKILEFKDWPGALGNLNITEEGIIISEAALKKVVNGEFVVIEE